MTYHTEITVKLKNEESNYTQKFLAYESYSFEPEDIFLKDLIKQAQEACKFEPDDIIVKAKMVVK